ncbi:MAG: thioredoxin family protein [Hyphomonadaceae bacterium]
MRIWLAPALAAVVLAAACSPAEKATASTAAAPQVETATLVKAPLAPSMADLFVVDAYDPARDPVADLELATEAAAASGKMVLIDVGGEWCSWCHILDRYLAGNDDVRTAFARSFVAVKVNYSPDNRNEGFLSAYGEIPGYPHFIVLDASGRLVASEPTSPLEQERGYNRRKMLAFAKKYAPAKR